MPRLGADPLGIGVGTDKRFRGIHEIQSQMDLLVTGLDEKTISVVAVMLHQQTIRKRLPTGSRGGGPKPAWQQSGADNHEEETFFHHGR